MVEKKSRGKIAATVEELIREPVQGAGYLLWDVDYYKEGADYNLLVTIENPDREKPIDLDDCEKVSRLLSPILDEADPIQDMYYLEVSSAGLERNLTRPEHFEFYLGSPVSVRLYAPLNGTKNLAGTLVAYDDDAFTLEVEGEQTILKKDAVAKVLTAQEL
ncbi:MAG: ribosome maturation factor RimP [Ruminococcaceae bacterium]|nr:ribosome maturation factor RimP [Oscillospiraceae bacterium]